MISYLPSVLVHASISRVHLFLMLQATLKGGELLGGGPTGRAHHRHQLPPLMVGEAGQDAPVVVLRRTGLVGVVRRPGPPPVVVHPGRARPVGAVARRVTLAPGGATVGLDVQKGGAIERNAEDPLGTVDMLSLTGHVPMVNRAQSVHGPVQAAGVVQVGPTPAGGRLVRQARGVGQTGQGLRNGSHGLIVPVPTSVAEAGHGEVDDVRPELFHLLVAQTPPLQHAAGEVLDDDVGHGHQAPGEVNAAGGARVQRDAQLVGVGVAEMAVGVEIGRKALGRARSCRNVGAPGIGALGPLNLDDLGSQRSQPSGAPGTRPDPGEVQHSNSRQSSRCGWRFRSALHHWITSRLWVYEGKLALF